MANDKVKGVVKLREEGKEAVPPPSPWKIVCGRSVTTVYVFIFIIFKHNVIAPVNLH